MSRILLAWELGGNFGHLTRQLLIAERLQQSGHEVFFAVRDTTVAAQLLEPMGFGFTQAPYKLATHLVQPPVNYAEILLASGYADPASLSGLVRSWLSLIRWLKTDLVVIDHSPTALFAAYLADMPATVIGTGFEIPPDHSPLASIRPWETISADRLQRAEETLLQRMNTLSVAYGRPKLQRLGELFLHAKTMLATYVELYHYSERTGGQYIGGLFASPGGQTMQWQCPDRSHVFGYLRPNMPGFEVLLQVLSKYAAETVVFAPGVDPHRLAVANSPRFRLYNRPISLTPDCLQHTNLVLSYGGSGLVSQSLLAGIPLLLMPQNVEQYLLCLRVEAICCGLTARKAFTEKDITAMLQQLLHSPNYRQSAQAFADRYANTGTEQTLDLIVQTIEAQLRDKL